MRVVSKIVENCESGFNSKRCDYEKAVLAAGADTIACFNSKRCDYESKRVPKAD